MADPGPAEEPEKVPDPGKKGSPNGKQLGKTPATEQLAKSGATLLFDKTLTPSDTSGQGRILIPKIAAAEHLPAVDSQTGVVIPFVDTLGTEYSLRFRYWNNGQGRINILEGTQPIQVRYGVKAGDTITFARRKDGMLMLCCSTSKPERSVGPGSKMPRAKAPAKAPAAAQPESQSKKRIRPSGASAPARKAQKAEALQDGVFRAIAGLSSEQVAVLHINSCWTATLNLAGEMYRAHFDSQEAALEAYHAAGAAAAAAAVG